MLEQIIKRIRENDPTLKRVELNSQKIGDDEARAFAEALQENSFLIEIHLGFNHIGDAGIEALAQALKINKTLKQINLESNKFGIIGAKALLEMLKQNKTLTKVVLFSNKTDPEVLKQINACIAENKKLEATQQTKPVIETKLPVRASSPQLTSTTSATIQSTMLAKQAAQLSGIQQKINDAELNRTQTSTAILESKSLQAQASSSAVTRPQPSPVRSPFLKQKTNEAGLNQSQSASIFAPISSPAQASSTIVVRPQPSPVKSEISKQNLNEAELSQPTTHAEMLESASLQAQASSTVVVQPQSSPVKSPFLKQKSNGVELNQFQAKAAPTARPSQTQVSSTVAFSKPIESEQKTSEVESRQAQANKVILKTELIQVQLSSTITSANSSESKQLEADKTADESKSLQAKAPSTTVALLKQKKPGKVESKRSQTQISSSDQTKTEAITAVEPIQLSSSSSSTATQESIVTESNLIKSNRSSQIIPQTQYGINYKISEDPVFPTVMQVQEVLSVKKSKQDKSVEEKTKTTVDSKDLAELSKNGYTENEIETFYNLGLTPLVLKKLVNSDLKLDIFQSIEVITTCIGMGKAESEKVKINNNDMVLIIGNTGAGKSTAVNYLHGCEMQEKEIDFDDVIVVKETSKQKEVVAIGHGKSKTFIPSVIVSTETGMAFCDCPGFSDNRGQEINISNAVNIRHTIENAKSVKIVLLIDYKTIKESRGNGINNLIKVLDSLFGSTGSLVQNAASILIGVTQTPVSVNDRKITLEHVQGVLAQNKSLSSEIIKSIKILDPLERRTNEQCGRTDWLTAIHNLVPVKEHQTRFNTVLNPEDELMLIAISREISKQINRDLVEVNHVAAAEKLEQMQYLKIIRRSEIDKMYQENVEEIENYSVSEEREIKKHVASYSWSDAYKATMQYQQFIMTFKNAIPVLQDNFIALIKYISDKQIQYHQENVQAAISALAKGYDQDRQLQQNLAYPLHELLNLSMPAINSDQAFQHLGGYLNELFKLDGGSFKQLIETVSNQLVILKGFADKLDNKQIIEVEEEKLLKELRRIAGSAQQNHHENVLKKLKAINIIVLELLEKLKAKIEWQINGKNILNILNQLQKKASEDDVISLLMTLTQENSISTETEILYKQLVQSQQLNATIVIEQVAQTDFPQLCHIVHENLLKIKAQLIASHEEEELRIRKDNEQKEVESVIKELKSVIQKSSRKGIKPVLEQILAFNSEQQELLKNAKEISFALLEKLQTNIDILKLNLNWESNGQTMFAILQDLESPVKKTILKKIFSEIKNLPELKAAAKVISFILVFQRELKGKLSLDKNMHKMIEASLIYMQGEMKKKKIEEDKRIEVEKQRNEARDLVASINNDLLPNSKFSELKVAILRLMQIAPEELETITVKTKIEEHINLFHEQLAANNYEAVKGKYILLFNYQEFLGGILSQMKIKLALHELVAAVAKHIANELPLVQKEMSDAFSDEAITNARGSLKLLAKLDAYFNAISKFEEIEGMGIENLTRMLIKTCEEILNNTVKRYAGTNEPVIYAKVLMQIQYFSSAIGSSHSEIAISTRNSIGKIIKARGDVDFLGAVAQVLMTKAEEKSEDSRYASEVLAQYPEFKRAESGRFRKHTRDRTADDIFRELKIVDKNALQQCYAVYHKEYDRIMTDIVSKFEQPGDEQVLLSAIATAQKEAKQLQSTTHYSKHPANIATIIANIFGVWSYLDAHSGGFKNDRSTLMEPHASQILSVLLLFGMDNANESMQNHFLEVKTGEGKSVITAAAVIAFGLLGYEVHVACYNPWLAKRDERYFKNLIRQFNLEQTIKYGDFDHHVNEQVARMGGLRTLVRKLLSADSSTQGEQTKNERSILFVDEVDVFFSEGFLGVSYNPGEYLASNAYKNLLIDVWNNRATYLKMNVDVFCNAIVAHKFYSQFTAEYPNVVSLMQPFLQDMYYGLINVANDKHEYICVNNEDGFGIGYKNKVTNSITHTIYGHNTAFAAVKEYQAGRLQEKYLEYHAAMLIICGRFSYAELPKLYKMIVGVTGTLFSLSEFENKLLENYNVKRKTAIPSVFKKQQLVGLDKVTICAGNIDAENDSQGYFYNIKKAVEAVIVKDRAVLLVFSDEERLKEYQKYIIKHPYISKTLRTNTLLLTTPDDTRNLMVTEAATRSRVTEMSREFGRGTDFVCRDSQLRNSNGVHVICAFFPEHEAEEVQIKGRTGRQSDPGSFEFILFFDDLKNVFTIESQDQMEQSGSKYDFLVQKRKEYQAKKSEGMQKKIDDAKQAHQETLKLAEILTKSSSIFSRLTGNSDDKRTHALTILQKFNP